MKEDIRIIQTPSVCVCVLGLWFFKLIHFLFHNSMFLKSYPSIVVL